MTGSNLMDIFTQKNITEIYQFENYVNSEKTLTELWDGQKSNLENESSAKWTIMVNTQYCGSVEMYNYMDRLSQNTWFSFASKFEHIVDVWPYWEE